MKYYSEKLDKLFESEKLLVEEEKKYDLAKAKEEKEQQKYMASKKEMASKIENANAEIENARENYAKIYDEAQKKIETAKAEAEKMLIPARAKVKDAQYKKYMAVKEFNQNYGPYTVSYTGEKAYNEFRRNSDWLNYIINEFF